MIERTLTSAQIAALQSDETHHLIFADLDWSDSGSVRVHTGLGSRFFAGQEYIGLGELGGISNFSETNSYSPAQLNLTLKVLDASLISQVMNDSPEGREVAVHLAILDDNKKIIDEIPYIFDGNVTKFGVQRGDVTKGIPYVLRVSCGDWLERWNQPPQFASTTDADQQHLHPGDKIFSLTEIIAGSPLSSLPVKAQATQPQRTRGGRVR